MELTCGFERTPMSLVEPWNPPPSHPTLHSDPLIRLTGIQGGSITDCAFLHTEYNQYQTNAPHYFQVCFLAMSFGSHVLLALIGIVYVSKTECIYIILPL